MATPPHSVRWLSSPSERRVRWSAWHAATEAERTLCGQRLGERVHRAERSGGFAAVTCGRCRGALSLPSGLA